jgi:tartrate-resistant acid phosphatase type 5
MLGDWGINSKGQHEVCEAMDEYASKIDFNFIISLGDNFYLRGVDSVEDILFQKVYENVYNKKKHLQKLKWWVILGNHDWYHEIT